MALKFGDTKGKAQKKTVETYEYKDNENVLRLVGGVLPRYVYWLKGTNNKDIPVECLAFDREEEKFNNKERDYVPEYFPDKKCSWSYVINAIDVKGDGRVKAVNLKKKLFEQIMTAAEDLGGPTDPDTGWDIVFKKVKTGPLPFNVEYQLATLKCKVRPLTEEERGALAAAEDIDSKYPRPTPEDVKNTLEKIKNASPDEPTEGGTDGEAVADLTH